jgi:hypothetical protein
VDNKFVDLKRIAMKILPTLILLLFVQLALSQITSTQKQCNNFFGDNFISDGQQYRALLSGEEVAEFHATFYENSHYRLAACGGRDNQTIIYNVYDSERNLIYSNKDYNNAPYWDLYFSSTTDCTIEARLDTNVSKSGIVLLLIGFKN